MSEDFCENLRYRPFQIVVIHPGSKVPVMLTEYICHWESRENPYQVGVEILEANADESGGKRLSGRIKTRCPMCGEIHEAVRKYTEFDFENCSCPRGHNSWQAVVTNIKREPRDYPTDKPEEYEFTVELRCKECQKTHHRLVKSVASTLSRIKRITIGRTGIEFEKE